MSKNSRFKEAVDSIRDAVGVDNAEERQDKVNRAIRDMERVESDYAHDLKTVTVESMKRKDDKISLKRTIEEKDDEITEVNKKLDIAKDDNSLTDITSERDTLLGFKTTVLERNRVDFVAGFETIKGHRDFEKVKPRLVLPDEEDGKMDFEKISDDDIEKNQVAIQDAKTYGLFYVKDGTGKIADQARLDKGGEKDVFSVFPSN